MTRLAALALLAVGTACGGHRHGPSTNTNPNTLFVEIHTRGSQDDALRDGAAAGLAKISFARTVEGGGEIEVEAEVVRQSRATSTGHLATKPRPRAASKRTVSGLVKVGIDDRRSVRQGRIRS